ncbi:putative efflux protein, MATE family [Tenacibaculum mesophilum]|uniref:Multidrug export protein MepA n=1 Tax=Tenacibaculum mesophilum TaxID=104268 RepID=A0ABN5T3C0_9FLAO|nr:MULTISPECIES: MATE family efflux transporter [Tenacibaculum]AZJ31719.1 MATE family efflux transporter [Tenacibaculum mesophilum]KAF9657827.1 MATE family efflux transporter [Tenacibaculum mesophilum]MCO7185682.1 MATE family efflux transporter [Tenacibaculum sp. XPcli2-G]QFS26973.1 MATE family efflux transporter [Tenacibaculum mesophilum]SHG03287.1 putative efflux protein, MATE family [Tenacibaculum mesophilum]
MNTIANDLGTKSISQLILKQAIPASIGILVMSINMIVDTIFVGRWIGVLAIAAITVVLPIAFLISSIGMGVGIGGSSIISRALGANKEDKAFEVFGNQISLTIVLSVLFVLLGTFFSIPILQLFGANGDIITPATEYFDVIVWGVPFLAFAMMGNPVVRAVGKPNYAMLTMLFPAIANIFLDIIFIKFMNLGMYGAGLATSISYAVSGVFILWFFISKKTELKIIPKYFKLNFSIVKEIVSLGGVTIVRQGTISILTIVLNYSLFKYGGEISIAVYGIINRVMLFALFPVLGVTQGFLPIAGYNYGANNTERVKETINKSILFGTGIAVLIFILIMLFPTELVGVFTEDEKLLKLTPDALIVAFLATPVITTQLIGSAYFQAAGKALPALLLTLLKQGFFLIPLVYLLPKFYGVNGVWMSFPIADVLSTVLTYAYLKREVRLHLN